ncbi:858_t:CDS:2 [Ambispora gerdemannii]|uniref:858_t:CDS:1 n=1 Tax=Ambispora gerdemannii TaxID=144530 RepID=A0A9N9G2Q9_9GLOM|nr:858_t:CDS:2 [Ambispora gerdemannii]
MKQNTSEKLKQRSVKKVFLLNTYGTRTSSKKTLQQRIDENEIEGDIKPTNIYLKNDDFVLDAEEVDRNSENYRISGVYTTDIPLRDLREQQPAFVVERGIYIGKTPWKENR